MTVVRCLSVVAAATWAVVAGGVVSGRAGAMPPAPAGHPAPAAAGAAGAAAPTVTGKVVQTMNAGPYTYVEVDDGSKKVWAAAPQFAVAVGDQVVVPAGSPMPNFHSKSLDRTFDVVYFVSGIQVMGGKPGADGAAAAHGPGTARIVAPTITVSHLDKAAGGYTVAELFANKAALVGKEVAVRGKVAKATEGVMGKNWLHIQDGTGAAGTNDVTATTTASAAVGTTVLVRGRLAADKDLGFGYKYDVLIEDANVTVE